MSKAKWLKKIAFAASLILVVSEALAAPASQPSAPKKQPLIVQDQGAFAFGGKILGDPTTPSLHCDHGHVFSFRKTHAMWVY